VIRLTLITGALTALVAVMVACATEPPVPTPTVAPTDAPEPQGFQIMPPPPAPEVIEPPATAPYLTSLNVVGSGRAMYPAFEPATLHYAVGCGEDSAATVEAAAPGGVTITGAGERAGLDGHSDIEVTASDAGGARTYTVHCVHDDFPVMEIERTGKEWDGLMTVSVRSGRVQNPESFAFLSVIDTNGVPRQHRLLDDVGVHMRTQDASEYPFTYFRYAGEVPPPSFYAGNNYGLVLLDHELREVGEVRTVAPLKSLDNHDGIIDSNGDFVLMAYEYALRDFSAVRHLEVEGLHLTFGGNQPTEDSAIQVVNAAGGQEFLWSSYDHIPLQDCVLHRFPGDYAHINSLAEDTDGHILASFRGCSTVLKIHRDTGAVIWRLGASTLTAEEWAEFGGPEPLRIVDDPIGAICGQHSARRASNGNLLVFDNGEGRLCVPRRELDFGRVVEYAIDEEAQTATWVRHYQIKPENDGFSAAQGVVMELPLDRWLVSWGRIRNHGLTDKSAEQVDPATGEVLWSLRMTWPGGGDGEPIPVRLYPLRGSGGQ